MNRFGHAAEYEPRNGLLQPTIGPGERLRLPAMPNGQAKRPKYVAHKERRLISENVTRRMNERYKEKKNRINALAEESGVGRSTVQRIVDPATYGSYGPTVDTMALLARALRCESKDLLDDAHV
jgi:hypothetical protein